jgi:two-component system, OmpR family, sensor kinase
LPGLRSLSNRLAVIFALIVLGAVGTIYLSVTPRLEDSLTRQKLDQLVLLTKRYGGGVDRAQLAQIPHKQLGKRIRSYAASESAEVLILGVWHGRPLTGTYSIVDSTPDGGVKVGDVQALAQGAVSSRRSVTGTVHSSNGRQAVAARPLFNGKRVDWVLVFADSLSDVQANVTLIRNQVLLSGAIALVIAVLAGYLVARALAARVRRLEQAARKVAAGDFSNPIRADSDDELGQLAAAFDDMQNQLARLDRARKQFIASASHELRTPIFSLGGFLELLADEDLDEETRRQFLEQVRGQVERMRNLATELLDLSRLEAGALELRPEPTDVGQLARDVATEFTPAAAHHGSDVKLNLRREPIELECDPERVAQVLRILLDNALTHTPPGTGVRVSAARANGHVRLEVSDGGGGIKHQNMPHIFEPFFTAGEEAQGAGLGLAIASELAGRMHGRLTVRSAPGATTFSLVLPA